MTDEEFSFAESVQAARCTALVSLETARDLSRPAFPKEHKVLGLLEQAISAAYAELTTGAKALAAEKVRRRREEGLGQSCACCHERGDPVDDHGLCPECGWER